MSTFCKRWSTWTHVILVSYKVYYILLVSFGTINLYKDCPSTYNNNLDNNNYQQHKSNLCKVHTTLYFSWNTCHLQHVLPIFLIIQGCTGILFIWMCICMHILRSTIRSASRILLTAIAVLSLGFSLSVNLVVSKDMMFEGWDKRDLISSCENNVYWFSFIAMVMCWVHLPCHVLLLVSVNIMVKLPTNDRSIIATRV